MRTSAIEGSASNTEFHRVIEAQQPALAYRNGDDGRGCVEVAELGFGKIIGTAARFMNAAGGRGFAQRDLASLGAPAADPYLQCSHRRSSRIGR